MIFPESTGGMAAGFLRLTHPDSDEYNDLATASLRKKWTHETYGGHRSSHRWLAC
jgi:hypothetical protein